MSVQSSLRASVTVGSALTITLWLSFSAALATPGGARVGLAGWADADYAGDSTGTFAPVSLALAADLGYGRIGGQAVHPVPALPSAEQGSRPSPPEEAPGRGGPLADPVLLLTSMSSDRTTARRGDPILYVVSVRNPGSSDARDVHVQTHIPEGTTFEGEGACDRGPASVHPDQNHDVACVDTRVFFPPPSSDSEHGVIEIVGVIPAGTVYKVEFTVRVNIDVPAGKEVWNHAHTSAGQLSFADSNYVVVRVH